jgi:prepilin-type N-terminal cleavage/methylation domain-containing protein
MKKFKGKMKTTKSRIQNGFTLVEILVAVIILSVGILAVSQMTVMGMRVNTMVNQRMYARVVIAQVFENLNSLPATHAWFNEVNGNLDLNAGVYDVPIGTLSADHYTHVNDPNARYDFLTMWNIAYNTPELGMLTARIWVVWGPEYINKISSDLIKQM